MLDRWTQIIIRTASRTTYSGRMNEVHCLNDRPCVSVKVKSVKVFRAYWRQRSLGFRLSGLSISVTSKNGEIIITNERSVHATMSMLATLALQFLYPISTNMPVNARITTWHSRSKLVYSLSKCHVRYRPQMTKIGPHTSSRSCKVGYMNSFSTA